MPQDNSSSFEQVTDTITFSGNIDSLTESLEAQIRYKQLEDDALAFKREREKYDGWAFPGALLLLAACWILVRIFHGKNQGYTLLQSYIFGKNVYSNNQYDEQRVSIHENYLTYHGNELNFPKPQLISMLNKRLPYFTQLTPPQKEKFISRLKKFMSDKVFKIHASNGYKEMPVLVSATAIQLSFGLDNYLLHDFTYIHIYPREFLGTHPSIRFLEGNVSGNCINISWKHLLDGFEIPTDGKNLGLHEMAHAYHFQNFECRKKDDHFHSHFLHFNASGNKIYEQERIPGNDFYSDYALKNFQEFWAESVELFFEKPGEMKTKFPELFDAIQLILKQDCLHHNYLQSANV